jgi:translation elongation factor EF-Ts
MVGRIESYIHSDKSTPNKGGVLVKVTCQTDFAAKTDEFKVFSKKVAMLAYAFAGEIEVDESTTVWDELRKTAGPMGDSLEIERQDLEKTLREKITVEDIVILVL